MRVGTIRVAPGTKAPAGPREAWSVVGPSLIHYVTAGAATGPADARGTMSASLYERWKSLTVRRPDDVPVTTSLAWHIEKFTEHDNRLMNNALPAGSPGDAGRGDAVDAIAAIALRESLHRHVERERGARIREAIELGATWSEVATALGVTCDDARSALHTWADAQRRLDRRDIEHAPGDSLGLDPEQHAAVLALRLLGDDERMSSD
ncbi:hypothetical protein GCM10010518_04400 [Kitasatospora cinereorecta]